MSKMSAAVAAAASALTLAAPAHAITNGQPDEGRHPYVGALVSHDGKDRKKHLICSGTLISPTVFLTAAHCLVGEPSSLYVSFDSFVGAPAVGPEVSLHRGTAVAHPEFADETAPGDTHDIAVVRLDAPVEGIAPAPLPGEGTLDGLEQRGLLDETTYVLVGYGREGFDGKAHYGGGGRRFATGAFALLESFKLHLAQTGTTGGTCNGDSGGPVLVGDPLAPVGLTSDGDPECNQSGVYYRVDTASARDFLDDFVTLPEPPPVDPGGPGGPGEPGAPGSPPFTPPGPPATPPGHVKASVSGRFQRVRGGARVRRLSAKSVQPGAVVTLRCVAPKRASRACPLRERRFYARTSIDLRKALGRGPVGRGALVEVTVAAPGTIARVTRWRIGARVSRSVLCLPPGAAAPRRC